MHRKLIILTFLAAIVISVTAKSNAKQYCNLCRNGKVHIACETTKESDCPESDVNFIKFNQTMKDLIVDEHNLKRNEIAGGSVANFKKACRMATMKWSDELAELALLNVQQCKMNHDQCHNTKEFLYSGQNLAISGANYFRPDGDILKSSINEWYKELDDTQWSHITSFPTYKVAKPIGHFTVMMAERNTHVGCAAAIYPQNYQGHEMTMFLTACNYATTNMQEFPIYNACATSGEKCQKGTNPKYTNLCSENEPYAVNTWNMSERRPQY